MSGQDSDRNLMERAEELEQLAGVLGEARAGHGAIAVAEAPAGHGKTALLRALRARATAAGFRVLTATGAALEREFAFGLVRQLFEPVLPDGTAASANAGLFTGAAALARAIFDPHVDEPTATDASHARLHGLYWLTTTSPKPVHSCSWSTTRTGDRASLRFLHFLTRRIEDLAVVLAWRPGRPNPAPSRISSTGSGVRPGVPCSIWTDLSRTKELQERDAGSLTSRDGAA